MSLINQMLKDLEKRRAMTSHTGSSVLQGVSWPGWRDDQTRNGITVLLLVVLCIAISAAGFVWYQSKQSSAQPITAPAVAASNPAAKTQDRPVALIDVAPVPVAEQVSADPQGRIETATGSLPEDEAVDGSSGTAQLTTVASLAPREISAPEALVTADARDANGSAIERIRPESIIKQQRGIATPVTKTPRPPSAEQRAEAQYLQALRYYNTGQIALAESKLHKVLTLDVGHVAARELLAAMLIRGARYNSADKLIAEGLEMFPQQLSFTQLKARMFLEQGNISGAIQILEQNEPSIETESAYYALRAALYQRNGQHERAVETYSSLVRLDNAAPAWWIGLAISQEALGQIRPALESYRHAAANRGLNNKLHAYVSDKIRSLGRQRAAH